MGLREKTNMIICIYIYDYMYVYIYTVDINSHHNLQTHVETKNEALLASTAAQGASGTTLEFTKGKMERP